MDIQKYVLPITNEWRRQRRIKKIQVAEIELRWNTQGKLIIIINRFKFLFVRFVVCQLLLLVATQVSRCLCL